MNQTDASEFEKFDSQTLWQLDQDHLIHPMSVWPSYKKQGCTVVVRGEGAYLYDADGNRYLDTNGGLWAVNIGYGRAEMAQAIGEQALQLAHANHYGDTTTAPAVVLAKKLAELAPGSLNHVFFSNGGSTANDSAIRIAHHYFIQSGRPRKKHIIARLDGYHGSTYLTASMSGKAGFRKARFHYVDDFIHHVSSAGLYRRPDGTSVETFCDTLVEELEAKILEIGPENVACFVTEPIMGIGGVLEPPEGYHRRTWEICKKYDVLYIHDEVITAFGRLGHMLASEDIYGVVPDIINVAKGITSGYQPLAATIISAEMFDVISASGADAPFAQGYTYTGHPVCCAAALKNIEILEREKICEHILDIGPYFAEKIKTLGDSPLVGDARGRGSIFCLEHVMDKNTKELFPAETQVAQRIADAARERGLIVRGIGELVVLSPPLIIDREQIDYMVNALHESEQVVADELIREGLWQG